MGIALIDAAVVLGIAAVLPLALGGRWRYWAATSVSVLVALAVGRGALAAFLVTPLSVLTVRAAVNAARSAGPHPPWSMDDVTSVVAASFAVVAAAALTSSRLGVALFGVGEPIVELTAVHFIYGGAAALTLAGAATDCPGEPRRRSAVVAVALGVIAPPTVALGFVTRAALAQVGGAVLMTAAVWLIGVANLQTASDPRQPSAARLLLGLSGVAVVAPMVLAVAWAIGQYWDTPALSIQDMARTHGVANALGFVVCGLVGRRLVAPAVVDAPAGNDAVAGDDP